MKKQKNNFLTNYLVCDFAQNNLLKWDGEEGHYDVKLLFYKYPVFCAHVIMLFLLSFFLPLTKVISNYLLVDK